MPTDDEVVCYQLIGWYPNIDPRDRKVTNLSDGSIFSSLEKLDKYIAEKRFRMLSIKEVRLKPDDPRIDFNLLSWDEQKERLDAAR